MSWIYIALAAHFLFALVFVLDKMILTHPVKRPLVYAFYPSFLSIAVVVLIPFVNFQILTLQSTILALSAGILFSWSLFFFYSALRNGEASRIVPFIGASTALATLFFSYLTGTESLSGHHWVAFVFLVTGSYIIVGGYRNGPWSPRVMGAVIMAAGMSGLSFTLVKIVYESTNFASGFIWARFGSILFSLILLSRVSWRRDIFQTTAALNRNSIGLLALNKLSGGAGIILQNYAVALGSVVLVNALQSTQYLFILLLAVFLSIKFPHTLTEEIGKLAIAKKVAAIAIIGIGLVIAVVPPPKLRETVREVLFLRYTWSAEKIGP